MKKYVKFLSYLNESRGAIAIMTAIFLGVLVGIVALSVDVGYILTARNELQNISDASSLAATRKIGVLYEGMSFDEQISYVCDVAQINAVAQDIALQNRAAGENITVNPDDIIIGTWDPDTKILTPTLDQPDAVGVTARRDENANTPVNTFFANIFGINKVPVSAFAIAALTAQSSITEGALPLPAGISSCFFNPDWKDKCKDDIIFYPTTESWCGWHTYEDSPSNAAKLSSILESLTDLANGVGTYELPEAEAGETYFDFTGGTVGSVFDEMKALFDAMRVLNDDYLDKDEDPNTWTTGAVVYETPDCTKTENPTGLTRVVGFTTVTIYEVLTQPDKIIKARVECSMVSPGRGGGANYGTKGSIPGLVQ